MRETLTDDEVAGLKRGDKVLALYMRGSCVEWAEVEVVAARLDGVRSYNRGHALVRRVGLSKTGGRFPCVVRFGDELRDLPPDLPPAPANVYADWLEDHGHPEAAAALRAAFPLGDAP